MSLMTVSDDPLGNFVWRELLNVNIQIPCESFLFYVQHSNKMV